MPRLKLPRPPFTPIISLATIKIMRFELVMASRPFYELNNLLTFFSRASFGGMPHAWGGRDVVC